MDFRNVNAETAKVFEAYKAFCPRSFTTFANGLIIASGSGPQQLQGCIAKYQRDTFESVAPSLHAVRDGTMPPIRRFWIERTKKAGKDSDLALMLMWLVAFPTRPFFIQVGAADRDQAAIVKRRMTDLLYYNPWLSEHLEIQAYKVVHKGGLASIEIVAADVGGSHGEAPHVLVVNELSHITKWEFVENLLDNADGVPQGLVILATNAGFRGSKADMLRQVAETSDDWEMHLWGKPAPWHNQKSIEDAAKRSTKSRFLRLWYGKWASGKGDAFDEAEIDRIFVPGLTEIDRPEDGWLYVMGMDLGVKSDHSGVVVLGINVAKRRLRVATLRAFEPIPKPDGEGAEVDLIEVERVTLALARLFNIQAMLFDPSQALMMGQRLTRKGLVCIEVPFSTKTLDVMASVLLEVVRDGTLEAYEDEEGRLRRDFGKFNVVEKSYGYRLEAVSDEFGHADVGTALVLCLPYAVELLEGGGGLLDPDENLDVDASELTEEEINGLPREFREMYDLHDDAYDELRRESLLR